MRYERGMTDPPKGKGSGGPVTGLRGGGRRPPGDVVPLKLDVDVDAIVERGRSALEAGDLDGARKALASAAARAENARDVLLLKAMVQCADDDVDGAIDTMDVVIAAHPDDVGLVASKAFLLLDAAGDPEGALPLLHEVLAFADEHEAHSEEEEDDLAGIVVEVSLRLVDAELAVGNVDSAIAAANDCVVIAKGFDEEGLARAALARALLASGDVDGAAEEAKVAKATGPGHAIVFVVAGRVAVVQGDEASAAKDFAAAHALDAAVAVPPKLSAAEFKAAVDAAVAALPDPLGAYVKSIGLVVAERADVERLVDGERSPETPLLLEGPLRMPGSGDPFQHRPTAAVLYQRSVEVLCEDDDVKDVITAVLIEVVSGFLGLEFEDDLAAFHELVGDDDDEDAEDALDDER